MTMEMTASAPNAGELPDLSLPERPPAPEDAVPQKNRPSPNECAEIHGTGPKNFYDRIEAFISRLSVRDNFWHSVCSFIWLPLAFFSGIRMKQIDAKTFAAVLPFRRFNRNWYRAMAGAHFWRIPKSPGACTSSGFAALITLSSASISIISFTAPASAPQFTG